MFGKLFGAVNDLTKGLAEKIQESFSSQAPSSNPRLGSYIDFQLSESVMSYITIDDKRLYFESYNPEVTVQNLQDQFRQFTGKDLPLENEVVKISPDMPLTNIIKSGETRNAFEQIINKIDKKQQLTNQGLSHQKRQAFQQIIKACNSFESFNAKITMHNGLLKPIQLGMKVEGSTTFRQIIKQMNKHPLIAGQDIIFESEQREFQQNLYDCTFQELSIKQRNFVARYTNRNSFLRGTTLVTVPTEQQTVQIRELNGLYERQIVCYDSMKGRAIINKMINSQTKQLKQFYRLTLTSIENAENNTDVVLECTGQVKVFVLTEDFDQIWVPVKRLKAKDRLNGISHKLNKIHIYQVKNLEKVSLETAEVFYGLQIVPFHQYIANSVIVHNNNNKFTITAIISNGTTKTKKQITFLRHQRISKYFSDSICYLGGLHLKNNQTFGDYQIQQFDIIYVYQSALSLSQKKDREIQVTEYNNRTYNKNEFLTTEKLRMADSCLAIYNERIIAVAQIGKIIQNQIDSDANVLVSKRTPFERLNYILNKEPNYTMQEQQIAQQIWQLKKDDPKFKKIRQVMIAQKSKIPQIAALGIYMYTLNNKQAEIPLTPFYATVNRFLRDKYKLQKVQQEQKFLPMTGWILKSSMRVEVYKKERMLYRGIEDIKLQKAFNLRKEEIKQNQIIVFTSFTSSSESKSTAQNFAGKNGSILSLKVRNGRSIEKYSYFPEEKEILIVPFTYFVINSFNLAGKHQTAELQQVPLPWTTSNKIIFWVDDNPQNNNSIINFCLQPNGIEVVQVVSTRIMKAILRNFFWIFKMLNKKVVIVSDMVRIEDGVKNVFAGIDLFESIFKEYGLSNRAIIYASDKSRAIKNLNQRNLEGANWFVTSNQQQLISEIMFQFQRF